MSDLKLKEGTLAPEDSIEVATSLQTNAGSLEQVMTPTSESNSTRVDNVRVKAIDEKFTMKARKLQDDLDSARDVNGKLLEANATLRRDVEGVHHHNLFLIGENSVFKEEKSVLKREKSVLMEENSILKGQRSALIEQVTSLLGNLEYITHSHSTMPTNPE